MSDTYPTVDGIRGHRVITPEEDTLMRQLAEETIKDMKIDPELFAKLRDGNWTVEEEAP